jgi:hypothetical protein
MSRPDFFSRSRFLKSRRFSWDFDASRFSSRLLRFVETHQDLSKFVETHPDLSRNLDIIETFWVWKWRKVLTNWEISMRKCKNPPTSWSRLRQTVEKRQNFQISMNFSIWIETFWSGPWCRDAFFENVEIFSTVETNSLMMSRSRLSIETRLRQIETSRLNKESKLGYIEYKICCARRCWGFLVWQKHNPYLTLPNLT